MQTAGQARGPGKHPEECVRKKARGPSSVETEEASASRPGGTLSSEARGKGEVRTKNYPLGLVQPGSSSHKISFYKEVEKKKNVLTDRGNGCGRRGIKGSKFRRCSRKRSGERKPLTKRKRRGTAVCILRQMLPPERTDGKEFRNGALCRCEGRDVLYKHFVSARWGAKLEAVSQDEDESVGDLRRNEKAWNGNMPVGRGQDQGTAARDKD